MRKKSQIELSKCTKQETKEPEEWEIKLRPNGTKNVIIRSQIEIIINKAIKMSNR